MPCFLPGFLLYAHYSQNEIYTKAVTLVNAFMIEALPQRPCSTILLIPKEAIEEQQSEISLLQVMLSAPQEAIRCPLKPVHPTFSQLLSTRNAGEPLSTASILMNPTSLLAAT
jgi:hypothetical protein